MVTVVGKEALVPNPALKSFELLVGEWRTTGTHPYFPGITFNGLASFSWHENGAFLIMHSEIDEPEIPSGVAIFGSDEQAQKFYMLYFDERRVSRKYDVSMTGRELRWWRNDSKFSQRFTIEIEQDGMTLTSIGEMSRDGADWETDLALTYVRIG